MRARRAGKTAVIGAMLVLVGTAARADKNGPVRVDPGNGITLSTDDGESWLNIGFWGQFRFQELDRDNYRRTDVNETKPPFTIENIGEREPSFQVARLRVVAGGQVFKPWIKFGLQLDLAANDEGLRRVFVPEYSFSSQSPSWPGIDISAGDESKDGRTVKTLDYYIDFVPRQYAGFRIGAFKVPFGRQELVSDPSIQMWARAIASDQFAPGRDRGVMFHGSTPEGKIEWSAGAFNGTGLGQAKNIDKSLGWAARLTGASKGPYLNIESNIDNPMTSGVRLQGGFSWYGSTDTPVRQDPRVPIGDVRDDRLAADIELFLKRFNLIAEYYTQSIEVDAVGSVTGRPGIDLPRSCRGAFLEGRLSCDKTGILVQAGVLLGSRNELSLRWSKVDNDKQLRDDEKDEATVNYTYFIRGHALKATGAVSWFRLGQNAEGSSAFALKNSKVNNIEMVDFFLDPTAFPGLKGDSNVLVTFQLQWMF